MPCCMIKLCECGCGNIAPIAKRTARGYVKGQYQRFLKGHFIITYDDLTGKRFSSWTVLSLLKESKNRYKYLCRCQCGKEKLVLTQNLINGRSKSCGCLSHHGYTGTKVYRTWKSIRGRCYYKKHISYKNYGARGIRVCQRWLDSFENFLSDMGESPTIKHTIERNNNDGNYEPSNCRWATYKEQQQNKRKRSF